MPACDKDPTTPNGRVGNDGIADENAGSAGQHPAPIVKVIWVGARYDVRDNHIINKRPAP